MVVPAGVTLVTLNIDPPVGVSPAGLRIRVDPTWPDVAWSANGQSLGTMLDAPRRGVVSVKVPAVDQNGFVNSDGQVMKGWQYVLTVEGVVAGASIRTVRLISPTVAGGALTFGVAIGEGGSASLPAYLSQGSLDGRYAPVSPNTGITYNPDGSVATVTENGVTTTYTYNSDGTVHTDVRAGVTRTYTYDASGNLTGIAS